MQEIPKIHLRSVFIETCPSDMMPYTEDAGPPLRYMYGAVHTVQSHVIERLLCG